jgi:hypothetical protein
MLISASRRGIIPIKPDFLSQSRIGDTQLREMGKSRQTDKMHGFRLQNGQMQTISILRYINGETLHLGGLVGKRPREGIFGGGWFRAIRSYRG